MIIEPRHTVARHRRMEWRELVLLLVRMFQVQTYVEVGVQGGWTFNAVAPLVQRAVAVDIAAMRGIVRLDHVEAYRMPSLEFARRWSGPIDLLFIDADHRATSVLADVEALVRFVRPQTGLILLHDTYPAAAELLADGYCSDAWRAARAIHSGNEHGLEIVTLPGPWAGISILRRARRHGWMDR